MPVRHFLNEPKTQVTYKYRRTMWAMTWRGKRRCLQLSGLAIPEFLGHEPPFKGCRDLSVHVLNAALG